MAHKSRGGNRPMMRLVKFVIALATCISVMAELGWLTINHPWLTRAHRILLKAIMTVLDLL
jgi:hypothetical protein